MRRSWHSLPWFIHHLAATAAASANIQGIPQIPLARSGDGVYDIKTLTALVVDVQHADSRDTTGETLIPPSLAEFAGTFAEDLAKVLGVGLEVTLAEEAPPDSIFLTVNETAEYLDASGAPTAEGYTLTVSDSGVVISAASALGAWWGTRTVLQQAVLSNDGTVPYGETKDAPGWGIRGMMLDAARHYYPPEFLVELCAYMSFFKQNTFHVHLSDNLYNNKAIYTRERSLELYARFRLWSEAEAVAGLNRHRNESYDRAQFDAVQARCAARGVAVVPEIEAPGHALAIVQWRPALGLADDLSLLNISHPETIPTMKAVWATFLPWFRSKTVHVGADEYTADVGDYNRFVNEMAAFIREESGKGTRIWGTFPPRPEYGDGNIDADHVSVQHWAFFEDNPYHDYIRNGYAVVNSDDTFYTVNKWSGSYPQKVPIQHTWHGDPSVPGGGIWHPHVFDRRNASNNPPASEPLVLGAVTPLWNDYGANASVYSEAYYVWREGIPALADKQWGGLLSEAEFAAALARLHPRIPAQNLERAVPSAGPTVFNYTHTRTRPDGGAEDLSGNQYNATTTCATAGDGDGDGDGPWVVSGGCAFDTPLSSKGRDYTLSLRVRIDEADDDATLILGADSKLMLTPGITLFSGGTYFRLNTTVPTGRWVDLSLVGRGDRTFAAARETSLDAALPVPGGGDGEEFQAVLGVNGVSFVWTPVAIEAPISRIGGEDAGWTGQLAAFSLSSET